MIRVEPFQFKGQIVKELPACNACRGPAHEKHMVLDILRLLKPEAIIPTLCSKKCADGYAAIMRNTRH